MFAGTAHCLKETAIQKHHIFCTLILYIFKLDLFSSVYYLTNNVLNYDPLSSFSSTRYIVLSCSLHENTLVTQ